MTLTLYPDQTFVTRELYLSRPILKYIDRGRWELEPTGSTIKLRGPRRGTRYATIVSDRELRFADAGSVIRRARVDIVPDRTRWRGLYVLKGGSGTFTHCATGRSYAVARTGRSADLDAAYETVADPSSPVLVTFSGHLVEPASLIVDEFYQVWPTDTCEGLATPIPLHWTHWRLVELAGRPVTSPVGTDLFLTFDLAESVFLGSTGCNVIKGKYTATRDALRMAEIASTRRACGDGAQLESEFLKLLEAVRSYRIDGETLELVADANLKAVFKAKVD
jgi:heat shock protein HslJ